MSKAKVDGMRRRGHGGTDPGVRRERIVKLRGLVSCSLALAGFVTPSGGAAATPAVSSAGPQVIAEFAGCLARRHHREVADYVIRANVPTSSIIRAEKRLVDRACIPARASRDEAKALLKLPEELRPALAEVLVREEFPVFEASQISAAQPLDYAKMADRLWPAADCAQCGPSKLREVEAARARAIKLMAPLVFGECAVRTDPANAHRLLLARAGSPEEAAAFESLQPAFGYCVMKDQRLGMSRTGARGLLSLNYYRLARSPRVQPAPGGAK